jgi:hypothetical protein
VEDVRSTGAIGLSAVRSQGDPQGLLYGWLQLTQLAELRQELLALRSFQPRLVCDRFEHDPAKSSSLWSASNFCGRRLRVIAPPTSAFRSQTSNALPHFRQRR